MPRDLPTGTVTFLFTDVEGSTKLLHRLGDAAYAEALAEHRRLLRAVFAKHDGVEVDTQGDAFFFAFPTASSALAASRGGLQALSSGPIAVRIGVHTGTPMVTDEGYVGEDVHRAARVAASGHGGQVLVSASTAALVDASAFALRDLGEHRFKDLAHAERVYQLGEDAFPPIRSLSPSNLPVPATPFLGRQDELSRIGELLAEPGVRVLTLTGPGGTGKTRLAIQAAAESSEQFPGGLWWVPLAPLDDAALVLSEVARSIGVEELPSVPLAETIAERTGGRRTLVVLDNAEHLLPRLATEIAPLTRNGAGATFLVTSRERLHLEAERELAVPSMSADDAEQFLLARAESLGIRLEPSATLSELADRLDRLPLAMQLAAARLKLFSAEQLLERLAKRLDLPGERDADPRQRTLRATIEWSHDLLEPNERALLRRLSVFAGGGTVEAIEAVCDADPDVLLSLVDKSLVRRRDDAPEPRFWMLETIREFAGERLYEAGETEVLRQAHARWCGAYAERLDDEMRGIPARRPFLDRLDHELDNMRGALTWAKEHDDAELLQRIAGFLRAFWHLRGHYREGRQWLEVAYRHGDADPVLFVPVLDGLSSIAYRQGDYELALRTAEEALPLARSIASEGELFGATTNLANALSGLGRRDEALAAYDEVVELARRAGKPTWVSTALINRGDMASIAGRLEEAHASLREAVEFSRAHGIADAISIGLINLSTVSFRLGATEEAGRFAFEAIEAHGETFEIETIALLVLAGVTNRRGDRVLAARFLGASEALREASGYELEPNEQPVSALVLEELGDALDDPEVHAAYDEGRGLEPDAANELLATRAVAPNDPDRRLG
jgi:predicted ATPase/class 3 adenylate cyclase